MTQVETYRSRSDRAKLKRIFGKPLSPRAMAAVAFVTATMPLLAGLFVLIGLGGTGAIPVVLYLGLLVALPAAVAVPSLWYCIRYPHLRHQELAIGRAGLTLLDRAGSRTWAWGDISGLAVVAGAGSGTILAIEGDPSVGAPRGRFAARPRLLVLTGSWRPVSGLVYLDRLEAGEDDAVKAIIQCSGGRFPGERRHVWW